MNILIYIFCTYVYADIKKKKWDELFRGFAYPDISGRAVYLFEM